MLLGEYSVRTGKKPQHKSTYTINTRLCHRGIIQLQQAAIRSRSHYSGAGHRPACQAGGSKRRRRGIRGGGVNAYLYVCVCVCVCVIVCNQCLYKGGGTQERLTAVLFPGVIFQQRPWPRLLLRGAKKDKIVIV